MTITVRELKEMIAEYPDDMKVGDWRSYFHNLKSIGTETTSFDDESTGKQKEEEVLVFSFSA